MVDYKYFDLFYQENTNEQAKIEYSGGVMTNTELFQNSEVLTESLCSEKELRFGCCEASTFKFKVANIVKPLIGEWITFSIVLNHMEEESFIIGRYKVFSDNITPDRRDREIVAYDAKYDIMNAAVADWYNAVLPDKTSSMPLRQFRESFLRHFGLQGVIPKDGLVNDNMIVEKTVMPEQISGKDVITAICEINGCFGHIGRDGKFHYIYLPQAIQGLWPADDLYPNRAPKHLPEYKLGTLYPHDPKSTRIGSGTYIKCQYEDLITQSIDKLQIRQEEDDIGLIYGTGDNAYIIEDNFLVYGKSSEQLSVIAENIYSKITGIAYRPFSANCVGNPCLEVGDPVRLPTKYEIVESYILKRTLKGIQALRDDYTADGVEQYGEKVNGVHRSIIQLKGKSNVLTRTIEETRLEMRDEDAKLYNTISVTAGQIRTELKNEVDGLNNTITITAGEIRGELRDTKNELSATITATAKEIRTELKNTKEGLQSTISQTASEIRTEVAQADAGLSSRITQNLNSITAEVTRATKAEGTLSSSIKVEADRITAEVKRASDAEGNLSSRITVNANSISAEVTRAKGAEGNLSASITVNANNIATKVSKNSIVSEINQSAEKITIRANKIDLAGLVTATEFTSKYATISTLNATAANLNNLIAQKASVSDLNATNAEISNLYANEAELVNLIAEKATIDELNAVNARFNNLNASKITSGTLSVDRLNVSSIVSSLSAYNMVIKDLNANVIYTDVINIRGINGIFWGGRRFKTKTISDVTYLVLD